MNFGINWERLNATPEEKAAWMDLLQKEAETRAELQKFEEAKARITQQKREAEEKLINLMAELPEKYLAWAFGKPRRMVFEHKTKISEAKDLIADCEGALNAIGNTLPKFTTAIRKGLAIRDRIAQRGRG